MEYVKLSNGVEMPYLALGTDTLREKDGIEKIVYNAIKIGFRHIDTAEVYHNEIPIGKAIKRCIEEGIVNREELFITTKAPFSRPGYKNTIEGFEESCKRLQVDYIDSYILHHPFRGNIDWREKVVPSWRALEYLYMENKVRSIGVSNFDKWHLEVMLIESEIAPMINQVQLHPQYQQLELRKFCKENNIQISSWGALNQGKILKNKEMQLIAQKYNKSVSQLALKWNIQSGCIPIVRSRNEDRLRENLNIFDFTISENDMVSIKKLDGGEHSLMHTNELWTPTGIVHYLDFLRDIKHIVQVEKGNSHIKTYKLFGFISFFKEYKESKRITRYYFFGIPILKIDTKEVIEKVPK